jgi:sialic acid synthase SpsE
MNNHFKINNSYIGADHPVYFIADIAANHDGSLERAILLIDLAKDSGADAVKFQHHDVTKYVSDYGFKNLGQKQSHQKKWEKSIFEVYKDAEVPKSWTPTLAEHCKKINIDFMSTPYDLDIVDHLDKFVPAFKIGSGDLAWDEMSIKIASKNKPIFIATGASTFDEVKHAHDLISTKTSNFCLMQCNTNYTGSLENFSYINLNVLKSYKKNFPNTILGLSDHTPGHETVLGSIALGAKAIEKHFTDDISRSGPDHPFSMDPKTWSEMVRSSRILEKSMGDGVKRVEANESETVILQRRAIRVIKDISKNEILKRDMIEFQRPCPKNAISTNSIKNILGKKVVKELKKGEHIKITDIE